MGIRPGSSLLLRIAWHHSNLEPLQVARHHLEGERIMLREPVIHYLIKVLKVGKTDFYTLGSYCLVVSRQAVAPVRGCFP